ncbi:MAG: hypothetical protein LBL07_02170 [Tannerella sp.]|jgi:hypothetical protein|nr:hypothetical protein [Tannerella sp.]
MKKQSVFLSLGSLAVLAGCNKTVETPPNIIFILADDAARRRRRRTERQKAPFYVAKNPSTRPYLLYCHAT